MGYPHGCIEQTTSRAYPLVMLKDLLPTIGVQVDEDKLMAQVGEPRAYLPQFDPDDGSVVDW